MASDSRHPRRAPFRAALALAAAVLVLQCQNPEDSYNTWSFSGYVVDGYSGRPLPDVKVYYHGKDQEEATVTTGASGNFFISELPYGERTFRFVSDTADSQSTRYTGKSVSASSWRNESSASDGEPGDISRIIRLFPMTGTVSGRVIVKLQGSELTVPAKGRSIRITYKDTAMADASPSAFEAVTDASGAFTFKGLPLASGVTFDIPSYMLDRVAYTLVAPASPLLYPGSAVSVGTIYMKAADTTNWPLNLVRSNVLSADGFGLTGVPLEIIPYYVLSTRPDSSGVEAFLDGGGSPEAVVEVRGDTVFVRPVRNLEYNALVTVTLTGKDSQGNRIHLIFDGPKQFRTERGIFPVASNSWDAAGQPIANFEPYSTLWVKYSENLDTNTARIDWQASEADHDIFGRGSSSNASVWIRGDTLFVKPDMRLPIEFGKTVGFKVVVQSQGGRKSNPIDFKAKVIENRSILLASNVISEDGFGLMGVAVDISPYYVLATLPDSAGMEATLEGGGSPEAMVQVRRDTVFVRPVRSFEHDALVTVTLSGKDRQGNRLQLKFDGAKQFRTERGVFPVASNAWDATGQPVANFEMYDTLWVKYSELLHPHPSMLLWHPSDADHDIFGSGTATNAAVWIRDDTLFVKPDLRLSVDFGKTMGFKVMVMSLAGKPSAPTDFRVKLLESQYYVKWTNAKDQFGNVRTDFGVTDSIMVVSNLPIAEVTGLSGLDGATPPPDMTLDNIRLAGDTLIYKPTLRLKPNTTYGMDFSVTFKNGIKREKVLGVSWKTMTGIRILAVDNRQGGNYRNLAVIGDSLTISFSKAVDTSLKAPIRFKVNIKDVKGIPVRTSTSWDASLKQATIRFLDTLPAADYDASPAYTAESRNTRAVDSITFDLAATDGEQVFKLGPGNETIELHTARGLCPLGSNILPQHDPLAEVDANETPVDTFPVSGVVTVTFNHVLDTVAMQTYGGANFAGLEEKDNGLKVPCSIRFSSDMKTLSIQPAANLAIGKQYHVWLSGIRGKGISGARAINKHGGSFTGKSTGNRLLLKPFKTKSPDIRYLEAVLLPDSNTLAGVEGNRMGVSAGYNYSGVAGLSNILTDAALKFRISESAWNSAHADSVNGYQVQVQKVDRGGTVTAWYDLNQTIASTTWRPSGARVRKAEINLATASFYSAFTTPDGDGVGSYYLNNTSLFNDSAQIRVRIRPYVGSGDPLRGEVGVWSSPVTFADNVAPCDSDFVTAANCNNLAMGGVQVTEHVSFNNASSAAVDTGYVEITFPEDMDPTGPVPGISFFYGPFGGTDPALPLAAVPPSSDKSRWISARKYRMHISVPVFDYTNALGPSGAFYNVSVAGCRGASGEIIQAHGSNGSLASGDIAAAGRNSRAAAAAGQAQGSNSVVAGFVRCD